MISNLIMRHPCLEKTFGLKFSPRKDLQCISTCVIYGMIWDHFWNIWLSLFPSKLRSKEAKGLKSGNLGIQFFLNINFLLDSILLLCTMVNFDLRVGYNWDLSFSKLREFLMQQGSRTLVKLRLSQVWKRENLNFRVLLRGNWPQYIRTFMQMALDANWWSVLFKHPIQK